MKKAPLPFDEGTEYTGVYGPAGVPAFKLPNALTPAQRARLLRLTGTLDPNAPISERVWNGEDIEKTRRQLAAEERDDEL